MINIRRAVPNVLWGLVLVALAACGTTPAGAVDASGSITGTSSTTASPAQPNPYGTLTIDPPGPHDPLLTLAGGSAGTVALTLAELEALGTETITIYEPFLKRRQTFTGVPLAAVLVRGGIDSGATVLTRALNDYEYAAKGALLVASGAIIATRLGRDPIPYDAGGPIRLIFPDSTDFSSILEAWNWSLSEISLSPVSASTATATG